MKLFRSLLALAASLVAAASSADAQQVISAIYGARGYGGADVTAIVQAAVDSGQRGIPVNNRSLGGDPAPGVPKALRVTFRDGRGSITRTATESSYLRFPVFRAVAPPPVVYEPQPSRPAVEPDYGYGTGEVYEGRLSTQISFRNRGENTVRIYSLSRWGSWRWVATLSPGQRFNAPAQPGQKFNVTDEDDQTLKQFTADRRPTVVGID